MGWRAGSAWLVSSVFSVACMQFGPLVTDLSPDERDQNAHNVAQIAASPPGETFRFALLADSHDDVDGIVRVGEALEDVEDLAFVVHAGDLTETGLVMEYRWALEALRTLPAPFVTVVGNHDALSNGKTLYREMFGPFDYAFRAGPILFVGFNSNGLEFGSGTPDVSWVRATIAADADAAGVVLVTHQGPASVTGGGAVPTLGQLVAEPRVIALVHGHHHVVEATVYAGRPVIGPGALQEDRRFVIVTVAGTSLSFEVCSLAGCEELSP